MDLLTAVQVPDEKRGADWENEFFVALSKGNLNILAPEAQSGPDGWPYLLTETSPTATESAQKILHWLSTRGLGLVVNPNKEYPDYVFSYGMVWYFRETGLFCGAKESSSTGAFEISAETTVHAGAPSPSYLPDYVRSILRDFFRDQSVFQPRILVMSTDRKHYDLAFSLESLGNPPQKEHAGIAEALSWFLPPHYSIVLVSEKGLPEFVKL